MATISAVNRPKPPSTKKTDDTPDTSTSAAAQAARLAKEKEKEKEKAKAKAEGTSLDTSTSAAANPAQLSTPKVDGASDTSTPDQLSAQRLAGTTDTSTTDTSTTDTSASDTDIPDTDKPAAATADEPPLDMAGGAVKDFVDKKVGDVEQAIGGLAPTASTLGTQYETKTNELKNQLNLLRDGNSGVWTSVADELTKSVGSLQANQLASSTAAAYKEHVDPIYREISNSGADPTEFLRRTDVAKVTADDLPARTLAGNSQNYMRTLAEVTGALGNVWKSTAKLQSDPEAAAKAKELTDALTTMGQQVVDDNRAAHQLHVLKNDANGRPEGDDPIWNSIAGEFGQFSEDVRTSFRADAAQGEMNARTEILELVGAQDAALSDLIDTTKTNQAMLDGQNLPIPSAEDNLGSYGDKLNQFLGDLSKDFNKSTSWTGRVTEQTAAYDKASSAVNTALTKWGWSTEDLRREDPASMGKLQAGALDLAKASTSLMDAQKAYADRVDSKAKAWMEGWETTKKKQAQEEWLNVLNTTFDMATGIGIAGDSILNIATKNIKNIRTLNNTFEHMSQMAADIADPLDLIQAAINAGVRTNALKNHNLNDALAEFDTVQQSISSNLGSLVQSLHEFYDNWDSKHYEGGFSNF